MVSRSEAPGAGRDHVELADRSVKSVVATCDLHDDVVDRGGREPLLDPDAVGRGRCGIVEPCRCRLVTILSRWCQLRDLSGGPDKRPRLGVGDTDAADAVGCASGRRPGQRKKAPVRSQPSSDKFSFVRKTGSFLVLNWTKAYDWKGNPMPPTGSAFLPNLAVKRVFSMPGVRR